MMARSARLLAAVAAASCLRRAGAADDASATAWSAAGGVGLFPPCFIGAPCYVTGNFSAKCSTIGGTPVVVEGLPNCALPLPATLFQQCGNAGCFASATVNFTRGCESLGGFVSGAPTLDGIPYCIAPGAISQFTACPASTSASCVTSQTDAQFAGNCTARLGGFIDATLGPVAGMSPECVANATVVSACGSTLAGCAPDAAAFSAACGANGGFITALVGGVPVCALPGAWTSWQPAGSVDQPSFRAACAAQGGFVSAYSVCLLPCGPGGACASASVSSASASGTPSGSAPPSASNPVTTTPLPSRSAGESASPTPLVLAATAVVALATARAFLAQH
jgi:hypothetical protein